MLAAADELEQELRQQVATFVFSYCYICVLVLQYVCPHATTYYYTVRIYAAADELEQKIRQQVAIYVSSYCYMCVLVVLSVRILLYMRLRTSWSKSYGSSALYICILLLALLYMCPRTTIYVL